MGDWAGAGALPFFYSSVFLSSVCFCDFSARCEICYEQRGEGIVR